jgi:DNA-directed RNA polymerase subunit delta
MEYLGEKVAYLKGLAEGLKIDKETDQGKFLLAMLDVLDAMADNFAEMESDMEDLSDLVDEIDEDLAMVEDEIYGEYDEDDICTCGDDEEDLDFYEVECPNCNEKIYLDEDMLENDDEITCPNCKEHIDIEFDFDCDEDCDHSSEDEQ